MIFVHSTAVCLLDCFLCYPHCASTSVQLMSSYWNDLFPQNVQHRKYARWKATYIHNCLKNGETPQPGPIGMEGETEGETRYLLLICYKSLLVVLFQGPWVEVIRMNLLLCALSVIRTLTMYSLCTASQAWLLASLSRPTKLFFT